VNTLAQILLTLALVTGGLAAYHVLLDDGDEAATGEIAAVGDRDLSTLEARVAALESRAPLLRGPTDGGTLLLELEARVRALEAQPATRTAGRTGTTDGGAPEVLPDPDAPVSELDVERALTAAQKLAVRQLVDGAVRERMQGRFASRVTRTLEDLGIEITEEQREQLDAAWTAHTDRVREAVRAGREAGRTREDMAAVIPALNQKFTQSVAEFLPARDAEVISSALTDVQGGPGRGPSRGPGRGPGGGR
jgi:hypothetical protein